MIAITQVSPPATQVGRKKKSLYTEITDAINAVTVDTNDSFEIPLGQDFKTQEQLISIVGRLRREARPDTSFVTDKSDPASVRFWVVTAKPRNTTKAKKPAKVVAAPNEGHGTSQDITNSSVNQPGTTYPSTVLSNITHTTPASLHGLVGGAT